MKKNETTTTTTTERKEEEMVTIIFFNEWGNPERVTLQLSQVPDRYL